MSYQFLSFRPIWKSSLYENLAEWSITNALCALDWDLEFSQFSCVWHGVGKSFHATTTATDWIEGKTLVLFLSVSTFPKDIFQGFQPY